MIGLVSALRILGGGLHQYGFTVFFLPVTQDLGLSRASTSLAFSLARAEGSLAAPIVGYLLDRFGPKPLMFAAALCRHRLHSFFLGEQLHNLSHCLFGRDLPLFHRRLRPRADGGRQQLVHRPARARHDRRQRRSAGRRRIDHAAARHCSQDLRLALGGGDSRRAVSSAGLPLCLGIHRSPESIGMRPDGLPLQPEAGRCARIDPPVKDLRPIFPRAKRFARRFSGT